ncbi:uncharacterized protein LOC106511419 [Austrofundulus limnaeus]|uniref:Uncharacterized protein LOC106511419 n=1 Tax=Austrofundulus limnaeus TaxID=52670 RepID=A0A2I4AJD8_AUSLI|nr:PREDICTED: uncharacterized protein LOC106511419 [Austrofundulus limnaeus]
MIGDVETSVQLQSKHTPHEIAVLTRDPSGCDHLTHVRCTKPQTIAELMRGYHIQCTTLWTNNNVMLSATAPCLALEELFVSVLRANSVEDEMPVRDSLQTNPVLYHTFKKRKIVTKYNAMRQRPYHVSRAGERDECTSLLYYTDSKSTLLDVINSDGRFRTEGLRFDLKHTPSHDTGEGSSSSTATNDENEEVIIVDQDVIIVNNNEELQGTSAYFSSQFMMRETSEYLGSKSIMEIEDDTIVLSSRLATEPREQLYGIMLSETRCRYTCTVCFISLSTHYLECGHVFCINCIQSIRRLTNERRGGVKAVQCPGCNEKYTYKPIITNISGDAVNLENECEMRCKSCDGIKRYMTKCGHLSCKCYKIICCVCRKGPVTELTPLCV